MTSSPDRASGRRAPSLAQLERDAALRRVSWTRRWVIAGAGALSAGFAALVASVAPGHSLASSRAAVAKQATTSASSGTPTRTGAAATRTPRMPPLASPSDLGLQGPSAAPQPAPSPESQPRSPAQSAPAPQTQAAPTPAPQPQAAPAPAPDPAPAPTSGGS
ncbi:MAG: hypothetical protein ACJ76X_14560 [Solirubrobacteraceae bacterium]